MSKCEICGSDLPSPDASGYQREHIVERCRDALSAALAESRAECERLRGALRECGRKAHGPTSEILAVVDDALDAVRGRVGK